MAVAEWGPTCFDGMTYTTSRFLGVYGILLIRSDVVDQISADEHEGYDKASFKPYVKVSVGIGQRHLPGTWSSGGPNDDLRKQIDQVLAKHHGNFDGLAFSDRVGCKFNVRSGRGLNHLMKDFETMFRSFGYAEGVPLWKKCPHGRYSEMGERNMCSDCSREEEQEANRRKQEALAAKEEADRRAQEALAAKEEQQQQMEQNQRAVQADRAANKRCTMCGAPLSIAERLLSRS